MSKITSGKLKTMSHFLIVLRFFLIFTTAVSFNSHADLTASEVNTVLAAHNNVRSTVSPTAANMTRLVWDQNLAAVAQNYANQCNFAHNANRNANYAALSPNTGQVGENIFVTTQGRAQALNGSGSAVALWAAEAVDYTFATNSCGAGKVCGHYTQVVWANTLRVGCGITQCPSIIGLPSTFNNGQLVICNYNPAGNFIGQSPYIAGTTGSQCPASLPNVVDGLCSPAASAAQTTTVPGLPWLGAGVLGLCLMAMMIKLSGKGTVKT